MAQLQSLADAPGTLREYETIYILHPNTINDKVADVNGRVKTIIEERGGQILNVDNWGKRKLAYEIKKERKGIYLFWNYLGTPDIVAEFERNMRLLDPVMRYMTIKLDTNVTSGSRETEVTSDTYERAATTAADEEEIMTGRSKDAEGETEDAPEGEASEEAKAAAPEAAAASTEADDVKAESTEAESTEAESTEAESTEAESTEAESTEAKSTEENN